MKANEVRVGGLYRAKVGGKTTTLRLDSIEKHPGFKAPALSGRRSIKAVTRYLCTNLTTGRAVVLKSATRLLGPATGQAESAREPAQPAAGPDVFGGLFYFGDGSDGGDPMRPDSAGIEVAPAEGDDRDDGPPDDGPDPDQQAASSAGKVDVTCTYILCAECGNDFPVPDGAREATCPDCGHMHTFNRRPTPPQAPPPGKPAVATPPGTSVAARLKAAAGASATETSKKTTAATPAPGPQSPPPHLIVTARAGTGKTTTLVSALQVLRGMQPTTVRHENGRRLTVPIVPSPQQRDIWDAVELSKVEARTAAFVAFNASIARELAERVPAGCEAMTLHSLGYRALNRHFGGMRKEDHRADSFVEQFALELFRINARDLRRDHWDLLKTTTDLVRLCKLNLLPVDVPGDPSDRAGVARILQDLVDYYQMEVAEATLERAFELVPHVLAKCADPSDRTVDFNDMIWLPVRLGLKVTPYDLLMVDEAQDLNRAQQSLARMFGRRLVFCGDDRQAIYGFTGSDSESLPRLKEELAGTPRGCHGLALTVTRRCAKSIVVEANRYVPDFEAHESNPEGRVLRLPAEVNLVEATTSCPEGPVGPWILDPTPTPHVGHSPLVREGDFILCRVNAPLVSLCFRFIRQGRKATIQGRDVAAGITGTIKKLKASSVPDLVAKVGDWLRMETEKEQAKRYPSDNRLIALQDKADCILVFTEGAASVDEVLARVDRMFTANAHEPGIRLSSIHKAKGLEAPRVFFYQPKGAACPHPMARAPWARAQEINLCYVATTRAINELIHCS